MRSRDKVDTLVVTCHECGHPIPSIPTWLATAKVKFECEECRQKSAGRVPTTVIEPAVDETLEPELGVDFDDEIGDEAEGEEDLELDEMDLGDEISEEDAVSE